MAGVATAPSSAIAETASSNSRPNIIFILADDMGFSDIGCYGSEVDTPSLNALAGNGLRFSSFYNNPRCCPSRASLLTGLYSHQVGFALMADNYGECPYPAYKGDLSANCVTLAEALRAGGYRTAMAGKWHLTPPEIESKHNWPMQRGFERFFGTIAGAASYYDPATLTDGNDRIRAGKDFYYTNAIGDHAVQYIDEFSGSGERSPFFLYAAFTAPHWPLQAPESAVNKYIDRFSVGWDQIRVDRHRRQIEMGLLPEKWQMSERDLRVPPWPLAAHQAWEIRRMAVYAAQIEILDQNIGRIVAKLKQNGVFDNTLILFMSDNGGNLEEMGEAGPLGREPIFIPHETFDGRLVHVGNNPDIMPGASGHISEHRDPMGQCRQHALPDVQALHARGRHLHPVHRALACRHSVGQECHHEPGRARDRRHGDASRSGAPQLSKTIQRQSDSAHGGHDSGAGVLWKTSRRAHLLLGTRRERRGAHRQVEARI